MARKRQTTRRQFLVGHSATEALADLVTGLPPEAGPLAAGQERLKASRRSYVLEVRRSAMACDWQVLLNAGQHADATEIAIEALDRVDALEEQLSIYRSHSEISRINHAAACQPVKVERELFALLQRAVALSEQTGGAFDITSTPLWKAWGFYRRAGRFPEPAEVRAALDKVGYRQLQLDAESHTVRFAREGMELNLGAIGKGYALDSCARLLEEAGVVNFLMHGGQSSIVGRGSRLQGDAQATTGWTIALRHPLRQQERIGQIRLHDRALGTSGSGQQYFHHAGRRYGHILDPRTGYPAEGILSATVLTESAADADALATGLLVMGREAACEFSRRRPELGVLLICPGHRSGAIEILASGLTDQEWIPSVG